MAKTKSKPREVYVSRGIGNRVVVPYVRRGQNGSYIAAQFDGRYTDEDAAIAWVKTNPNLKLVFRK